MRFSLAALILALVSLAAAGGAAAPAWKKIEASESDLVVAVPEFAASKPFYFDRAGGDGGREALAGLTTDRAGYAGMGHLAVFWLEVAENADTWKREPLRSLVALLPWTAGKHLVFGNEQGYDRDGADGRLALFTYRPQTIDRPCVAGQIARTGAPAERLTAIFCQPIGTRMDLAAAKARLDQIGTKLLPPVVPTPEPVVEPSTGRTADRLRELKDLLDRKLISEAEYEQKRKAILDAL